MGLLRFLTENSLCKVANMGLTRGKSRSPTDELKYKRLPPDTIRVVKMKPGTAAFPIKVKLKTVDYRTTKYTALSYTWENDAEDVNSAINDAINSPPIDEPAKIILCNDCPIRVSRCLWDVLEQLRDMEIDVPIWIDRLCIDFNNREERAAQTNMMGTIYGKASYVVAWLGKKTPTTTETIRAIRKIVNSINWRKIPRDFQYDLRNPRLYRELGIDRISVQQWKNIYTFCNARWFSRLWAFHELVSAKQAVFLIGDIYMDYEFLIDFAMILGLTGWLDGLSNLAPDGPEEGSVAMTRMLGPVATLRSIPPWHPKHAEHAQWMKSEYRLDTETERAWKFLELMLQTCEGFECQDPRDRIFASLAYIRRIYEGTSINQEWPIMDYGNSAESVYAHFTSLISRRTHAPSILATANIRIIPKLMISRDSSTESRETFEYVLEEGEGSDRGTHPS